MEWVIAHGLVGRTDLPIPEWLFGWAAAAVLIVSFVALAVLWPKPKLEGVQGRELFPLAAASFIDALCGAVGVLVLVVIVWSGLTGEETPSGNFASIFVFIIFWVGLAFASVLFGDFFKAFNPWRAIGRGVAGIAKLIRGGGHLPAPLPYPGWLGRWPAAIGIFGFAFQELAASDGNTPEHVAIATLVYSALTFIAMALYGVDRWIERGEAFSVYFNLFSRISPLERRGDSIYLRKPLSGLAALEPLPGTVPLLAVMIGSTSFDGAAEAEPWVNIAPDLSNRFQDLGMSPDGALAVAYTLGLLAAILIIYTFFTLGIAGARTIAGGFSGGELANRFVHSIVPIAFVYVAAHYFTFLLFEGQRIWPALSDPDGTNFENWGVDYSLLGANATWYWQVGFVITGHVCALMLAHDRALILYDKARDAVRSQYWMLAIMVGFTSLALWLLSQANQ